MHTPRNAESHAANFLRIGAAALALAAAGLGGCASEDASQPPQNLVNEGRAVFGGTGIHPDDVPAPSYASAEPMADPSPRVANARRGQNDRAPREPSEATVNASPGDWTIALLAFRGPTAREDAARMLYRVQTEGGLGQAAAQRRGEAFLITYGRYTGPDDPRAASDLSRVKGMVVDGVPVYASAYLVPPPRQMLAGSMPQYNLESAKSQYPGGTYTLEIAMYEAPEDQQPTEKDLAEIRRSAERAVSQLRQEGELAWYYHSPTRSSVTIGVFNDTDFDPQSGLHSQRLREARARHPDKLINGAAAMIRLPGMPRAQKATSHLVRIPEPRG